MGHAGNLDAICTTDKDVEKAGDQKSVFKVVDFFQQCRGDRPVPFLDALIIFLAVVIPDIPFIKADFDVLSRPLLGFDIINHATDGHDVTIQLHRTAEIVQRVLFLIAKILVQRDVIDTVIAFLKDRCFPFWIGLHLVV